MVNVIGIDHLSIRVSDLERQGRFTLSGLWRGPDGLKLEVMFFLEKQKRRQLGRSRN
jgi:hypothetical protein